MAAQSYESHRHNPKLTTAGFFCLLLAIVGFSLRAFHIGGRYSMGLGLAGLVAVDLVLLGISREYTTRLQDRIIKLEMKIRCAPLLSAGQQDAYARLTNRQIVALRFASDAELPALVERADREHLSADDIKRAIRNWLPDWDRT